MDWEKGDTVFGVKVPMQKCLDINQDLYICFVDFEKAFDKVRHEKIEKKL